MHLLEVPLFLGSRYIPAIIDRIGKDTRLRIDSNRNSWVGIWFVICAKELGLSVVTGAFLAGVLVAKSKSANVAKSDHNPIKRYVAGQYFLYP